MKDSYDVMPYGLSSPMLPTSRREISRIAATAQRQQAVVQAKVMVGEFALYHVAHLKTVQHQLETAYPDCAEALALIANSTVQGIARSVANFAIGLD